MTALDTATPIAQRRPPPLAHLPGPKAPPLVGHTLQLVRDPLGLMARSQTRFGPVFRLHVLGKPRVYAMGPDILERLLMDPDRIFSAHRGWEALHLLFPGGLMLRDGDDHRAHRRVMQSAFRADALAGDAQVMNAALPGLLARWPVGEGFRAYPAVKALTLDLGARIFLGLDDPAETRRLNTDLAAEVTAALAVIRRPLPLTPMGRGVRARHALTARLTLLIAARRQGSGGDLFSRLCRSGEEGERPWTDAEIVDHFNFLMMAAHDTTASALTTMLWALARHPDWQDRVRSELLDTLPDGPAGPESLDRVPLTMRVFHEALRLRPPLALIPRSPNVDWHWQGHDIPAGTSILVSPAMVLHDPALWSDPDRFDPDRFAPDRAEHLSHRFAFAPFGGGAHKCIGLHFAGLQVVAVLRALLSRRRVSSVPGAGSVWRHVPISKPADGLPLRLDAL